MHLFTKILIKLSIYTREGIDGSHIQSLACQIYYTNSIAHEH
jgi:hypothetical protein